MEDYSESQANNYAGYGLRAVNDIQKGSLIGRISLDLGLVSNMLVDSDGNETDDDELLTSLTQHTHNIAERLFPSDLQAVARNRTKQHLLLTQ